MGYSGRPGGALRTGALLKRYLNAAEPRSDIAAAYLRACQRRNTGFRFAYAVLGIFLFVGLGIYIQVSKSQYPPALAAKGLFVQMGVWPVTNPVWCKFHKETLSWGITPGRKIRTNALHIR